MKCCIGNEWRSYSTLKALYTCQVQFLANVFGIKRHVSKSEWPSFQVCLVNKHVFVGVITHVISSVSSTRKNIINPYSSRMVD